MAGEAPNPFVIVGFSGAVVAPLSEAAATAERIQTALMAGGVVAPVTIEINNPAQGLAAGGLEARVESDDPNPALGTEILAALAQATGTDKGYRMLLLRREGLHTVRDLLVAGRRRVEDIDGLGQKTINALDKAIKAVSPDARWRARPTADNIARLCRGLDQVTATVIGTGCYNKALSIQDLLLLSDAELQDNYYLSGFDIPNIKIRAHAFAAQFLVAKARLSPPTVGEV